MGSGRIVKTLNSVLNVVKARIPVQGERSVGYLPRGVLRRQIPGSQ